MLKLIIEFFKSLFGNKQMSIEKKEQPMKEIDKIDWANPKSRISKYFTVHEATYLPSWRIYHSPSEEEKEEIVKLAKIMDTIRERIGKSCIVHVWIRPKKVNCPGHERDGQDYNLFIGSKSTKSGHIFGQAIDFHFATYAGPEGCAEVREIIKPWLEELDIRMEDIEGGWVHIDTKPVGKNRFFKP